MSEPRKNRVTAVSRPQRERVKSLTDIVNQQSRLLDQLDKSDPRYARIRNITIRYADNIYDTPESRADRDRVETIARSSDDVTEERGRRIAALNRAVWSRQYPRSVYARNRR